jgi:hypothetical protein
MGDRRVELRVTCTRKGSCGEPDDGRGPFVVSEVVQYSGEDCQRVFQA